MLHVLWRTVKVAGLVMAGALVVVGLAIVGLMLYLRTDAGHAHLKEIIESRGRARWPGLHVGQVGGDVLHELWLEDVTIRDAQGRPAVHVARVQGRYRLGALLRGRLEIVRLSVVRPSVVIRPLDDGSLNLQHLGTAGTAGPTGQRRGRIRVQEFTLREGRADVILAGGRRIQVADLRLSSSGTLGDGEIDLGTTELQTAVRVNGRPCQLALRGRARVARNSLDVETAPVTLAGPDGARVILRVRAAGPRDRLAVHVDMDVPAQSSSLRARGTVDLRSEPVAYDLQLDLQGVNPRWFSPSAPEGQISARGAVQGAGTPLQPGTRARAHLTARPFHLAGIRILELRLDAEALGTSWTIRQASLRGAGARITLRGRGVGRDVNAELQARAGAPEDGPHPDIRGHGVLRARLRGRFPSALDVNLAAVGSHLAVRQSHISALRLRGKLAGDLHRPRGRLTLVAQGMHLASGLPDFDRVFLDVVGDGRALDVSARAQGPQFRIRVAGRGRVEADEVVARVRELELLLRGRDLAEHLRLLEPATVRWASGRRLALEEVRVQGQGTYAGQLALDAVLTLGHVPRGHAKLLASNVQLPGVDRFSGQAQAVLGVGQGELHVNLDAGCTRLRLDAQVPLTRQSVPHLARRGPLAIRVASSAARLERLPLLARRLTAHGVEGGVVELLARVQGDVARPDVHIRASLHDLDLRLPGRRSRLHRLPRLQGLVALDSEPGGLRGRLQMITGDGASLQAEGRIGRPVGALLAGLQVQDAPVELNADLRRLDLASLSKLDDRLLDLGGMVAASARLRGTPHRPLGTIDAVLTAGRVDRLRLGPVRVHASLEPEGTRLLLEVAEIAGGQLHARAEMDQARRIRADVRAHRLHPGFARLFLPRLREADGLIEADVQASGPLHAPELRGTITWREGRVGLVGQPTFDDVRADVRLRPGRIDVETLHASSAGGTLDGEGFVLLEGLRPVQIALTVQARRFMVALATGGVSGLRLNGDFALDAALHESVLSGRLDVPRATLRLPSLDLGGRKLQPIGPRDDVHFVDEAAKAAAEEHKRAGGGPALRLDLQANAENVQVRGQNLDIDVVSNLHVGTAAGGSTVLAGTIEIRRGHIDVSGQRFDVDYGRVAFDGTTEPRLDIRVTHLFPEALVAVEVRGTPQKPELRLSSDPPTFDQAQIVSLILTGQAGGQPSADSAFDPKAAVASAVLGQIADKLAPRLGVDVLRVQSAPAPVEAAAAGTPGTRLEVGKYISSRVYLSYAHVFGASTEQNANEASVQYTISRGWILETIFGDAGVGSLDALWTYRY